MRDTDHYELSEADLNSLGYDFMGEEDPYHMPVNHMYPEALEVFRLNIQLYPASSNVYDSYGEALLKTGRKDEAIRMYERALELNPHSQNAKKVLEQLRKDSAN
jgi:tetratricopeptide (TPR) repeat protein